MSYSGAVPAHVSPTLRRSGEAVGSRRRPPTHIYQTYIYSVNNSPWAVAALIYYLLTSGAHVVRGRCRVSPPPRPRPGPYCTLAASAGQTTTASILQKKPSNLTNLVYCGKITRRSLE